MAENYVEDAMSSAGITELDHRGLMPLASARKHLASVKSFGSFADKDDTTWAALVSLADGKEFVREARRLKWKGSPRGMENVAPFQRYGVAIRPWLLDFCNRRTKTLRNDPWCIAPCLVLAGGEEAFEAVLDTTKLVAACSDFESVDAIFEAMLDVHPEDGWPSLAKRVLGGDARATTLFARIVKGRSRGALDAIGRTLGADARAKIEAKFEIVAKLEAGEILGLMDTAQRRGDWPIWNHDFEETLEYLALRLVAARGQGDQWGICLERLTGSSMDYFSIQRFVFGSEVKPGRLADEGAPDVTVDGPAEYDGLAIGSTIRGPKGKLTLKKEDVKALALHPGKGTEPDSGGEQLVLMRAYLTKFPHTIFPPTSEPLSILKLKKPRITIVSETFRHAGDRDELPSKSKTYKSLADALVACDAKKFVPGTDNTDWRKHLVR